MSFGGGASFDNAGQRHSILLTISVVRLLTRVSARPSDYDFFTGAWPKRSSLTEKAPRQRRPDHFDRAGDVTQAIGQYRLAGRAVAVRLCAQ